MAATVGVAADYWGDGLGFGVELLLMMIGVTTWGGGLLRARVVPVLWAWLMVVCGPGAAVTLFLIGHVPSGPTLSFAIVWLVVGCLILSEPAAKRQFGFRQRQLGLEVM
jgi:hypothetical protein